MFQIWLDWLGGYWAHSPFDSIETAEDYISSKLYSYRQYHRVRICDMRGNDIKIIEPLAN